MGVKREMLIDGNMGVRGRKVKEASHQDKVYTVKYKPRVFASKHFLPVCIYVQKKNFWKYDQGFFLF